MSSSMDDITHILTVQIDWKEVSMKWAASSMNGITHKLRVWIEVSMEWAAKWMALRTAWEFKLVEMILV